MAETEWESIKQLFKENDKLIERDRKSRERLSGPWPAPQPGQEIVRAQWRGNLYTGDTWIEAIVQRDGTIIQLPPWPRPSAKHQYNWCLHCNNWHPTAWMIELLPEGWPRLPEVPGQGTRWY